MPRFFVDNISETEAKIAGADAVHIIKSLRMKVGEELILCDKKGFDYECVIDKIDESVICNILEKKKCISEPTCKVTLYQAFPKGDKFETIIQKCVELGINEIVPVLTARCISRPDQKSFAKKLERYNKIALEAAKQSGRGIIPKVNNIISFNEAIVRMKSENTAIIFYEGGGQNINKLYIQNESNIGLMIGSEGGFEEAEIEYALKNDIIKVGLGPRILRCETAPIAALAIIMNITENM